MIKNKRYKTNRQKELDIDEQREMSKEREEKRDVKGV